MSLTQYFHNNTGLPINKWAHYLPLYERYFSPFRNKSIFFLEIGTGQGGSSRMWQHYFGPCAQIVTVDIRPECKSFENEQIKVRIGDQSNHDFLQSIIDEFGLPDLIVDDGSHIMEHVKRTFNFLFPRMSREAVYFVEDMHAAYWPSYGGGLRRSDTFIEEMKNVIDEINSFNPHHAQYSDQTLPASDISSLIRGLHFHESVVVIEKGPFLDRKERSIPVVEGQKIW